MRYPIAPRVHVFVFLSEALPAHFIEHSFYDRWSVCGEQVLTKFIAKYSMSDSAFYRLNPRNPQVLSCDYRAVGHLSKPPIRKCAISAISSATSAAGLSQGQLCTGSSVFRFRENPGLVSSDSLVRLFSVSLR